MLCPFDMVVSRPGDSHVRSDVANDSPVTVWYRMISVGSYDGSIVVVLNASLVGAKTVQVPADKLLKNPNSVMRVQRVDW